ncbi:MULTISPECIES: terminase small subunit [Streptococcus]|nr:MULTISPECIES: terminase small subunit [Streptococcus]
MVVKVGNLVTHPCGFFGLEVVVIDRHQQIVDELTDDAIKLMSDWPSSREKQRQFVLAYVASGFKNATEAARQVGYSDRTAKVTSSQLLTKPNFFHVQEVIKILKENFDKRSAELSIASAIEIKQFHTAVMRGEVNDTDLIMTGDGMQEVIEIPARLKERQKSADSLAKMLSEGEATARTETALDNYFKELEDALNGD